MSTPRAAVAARGTRDSARFGTIGWTLLLAALTLGGWWARSWLVASFPLREDEAIYAYWALHFLYEDPYFLTVWPDKPPLFLWALAAMFGLVFDAGPGAVLSPAALGQFEVVARWVSLAASTLTIPLAAQIARRWWGAPAGFAAGLWMAANPFAIAFGPTVYTDSLLVLGGMLALAAAARGRWLWAGMALGAALMTKQQGIFYMPLVLGAWGMAALYRVQRPGASLGKLLVGTLVVVGPIVYWDSLRWAVAPAPWDLATRTYGPVQLAVVGEWMHRGAAWGDLLWYLAGSNWVWAAIGLSGGAALLLALRPGKIQSPSGERGGGNGYLVLLVLWSVGFVAAHLLTTVQIWDRYLLPLSPVVALGMGWAWAHLAALWGRALRDRALRAGAVMVVTVLVLAGPAQQAAQGRFPIGADHGDYAGLHTALEWLDAHGGERFVLYHQALGWHYRFYLYAAPAAERVTLRWFASPVALADNAAKTPWPPKYLVVPDWAPQPQLALHLKTRQLTLVQQARAGRFRVFEIQHLPQAACTWCQSRPRHLPWQLAQPTEPGMMSQP